MQVYDVIVEIESLTDEDALNAGAIISTDVDKTNYFLSIPDRMKKLYVQGLLGGSMQSISYLVDLDTILILEERFYIIWTLYYFGNLIMTISFLYFGDFIMIILH